MINGDKMTTTMRCENCGEVHNCANGITKIKGYSRFCGDDARLLISNSATMVYISLSGKSPLIQKLITDDNQPFINLSYDSVMELREVLNKWLVINEDMKGKK